jgi:glycosyltransferase involved in cell wall biosynthesis
VAEDTRAVPQIALNQVREARSTPVFSGGSPTAGQSVPSGRTSGIISNRRNDGTMPEVSIIIATYNRGPLLEEALDSVLSQTYVDYEIIVVDDGSTDDTSERLLKYSDKIKIVNLEHTGKPSIARNAGLAVASGRLLAFLDSDDLWAPTKLERQVRFLQANPFFIMCYCDANFLSEDGRLLYTQSQRERLRSGRVFGHLLLGNFIPLPTVVVRRDVVQDVGGFEEWLTISEDWHLWVKVAAKGRVGLIEEPLCQIRVLSQGITSDRMFLFEEAVKAINDLESRFSGTSGMNRLYARRGKAKMLSMLGRNYLFSGETAEARRLFSEALTSFPLRLDATVFYALACLGRKPVLTLRSLKKAIRK